jgi:hypothetical protein
VDDESLQIKQIEVRQAACALARAGLVSAYGHRSARIDAEREFDAAQTSKAEVAPVLTEAEAKHHADWGGQVAERMWSYLTFGDPEVVSKPIVGFT